jgi:hypothetical protein
MAAGERETMLFIGARFSNLYTGHSEHKVAIRPGDVFPEAVAACHALQDSIHEARVAEVEKTGPGGSFNRAIVLLTLLLGVFLSRFSTFYRQQSKLSRLSFGT